MLQNFTIFVFYDKSTTQQKIVKFCCNFWLFTFIRMKQRFKVQNIYKNLKKMADFLLCCYKNFWCLKSVLFEQSNMMSNVALIS